MIDGLTGVLVGRHILLGLAMPGTPTRSFGIPGYGLFRVLQTPLSQPLTPRAHLRRASVYPVTGYSASCRRHTICLLLPGHTYAELRCARLWVNPCPADISSEARLLLKSNLRDGRASTRFTDFIFSCGRRLGRGGCLSRRSSVCRRALWGGRWRR